MKKILPIIIVVLLFVVACGDGDVVLVSQQFIGGTTGLTPTFEVLPERVFDGGEQAFEIVVKLLNEGESSVAPTDIIVSLEGVLARDFDKIPSDFVAEGVDDIIEGKRLDPQGNTIPGVPVLVEFLDLNHQQRITGAELPFPIRAIACYEYSTQAVTQLCVVSNPLSPDDNSICQVNGPKTVSNSGAPIHIANVKQSASSNKIRFSFDIQYVGTGDLFRTGSSCGRGHENKVFVHVEALPELTCTGLSQQGTGVEGEVTLFDNVRTISCSVPVSSANAQFATTIELKYRNQDSVSGEFFVKRSIE
jgi:hypothetical protein